MSENKEIPKRDIPVDLYVLQPYDRVVRNDPNSAPLNPNDENYTATLKRWGDYNQEKWTEIHNPVDLLHHVINNCGDQKYVRMLRIGGHGTPGGFYLGEVWIDSSNLDVYKVWLDQINPFLKPGKSLICLDHCETGNDENLLKSLSKLFNGVPVIASLEKEYDNEGAPQYEGVFGRICNSETCLMTISPNDKPSDLIYALTHFEIMLGKIPLIEKEKGIWSNFPK